MSIEIKETLGCRAAQLIESGMIVGLGTGSTAECFISSLIGRVRKEALAIQVVASSKRSEELALAGGMQVLDINAALSIDMTIDGADEIDPKKRLIKGAGGALLREKILAAASRELIVISDASKLVPCLGKTKLPVEILYYGASVTRRHIEKLGYKGRWRPKLSDSKSLSAHLPYVEEELFLTDQGNVILDLFFEKPLHEPEEVHEALSRIPGVIETGFFFHLAKRILIGYPDGSIKQL